MWSCQPLVPGRKAAVLSWCSNMLITQTCNLINDYSDHHLLSATYQDVCVAHTAICLSCREGCSIPRLKPISLVDCKRTASTQRVHSIKTAQSMQWYGAAIPTKNKK